MEVRRFKNKVFVKMALALVLLFFFLSPALLKAQTSTESSKNEAELGIGYLTSGNLEMDVFYMHQYDFSFNAYLESNFGSFQFYDFDFTYQFAFPFSLGAYIQFDNSFTPGAGLTLGAPIFTKNGHFIDPYVKTFYEFNLHTTGINVGLFYSYKWFSMMLEADFYTNEGLDMLQTEFIFYLTKNFGIYTGFDMFHDYTFEYKLGITIKFK